MVETNGGLMFGSEGQCQENRPCDILEEMLHTAFAARAGELGIDIEALQSMMHYHPEFGTEYMGVIPEDPVKDGKWYGTPRHSGRYPWGSGDNPYQRNASFLGAIETMRKAKGPDGKKLYTEKQIAESMGMNTSDLRKKKSLALAENREYERQEVLRLKAKGLSTTAIAKRMERNESSIRSILDDDTAERMNKTALNAKVLKDRVEQLGYIDIGKGSERYMGITSTTLGNAVHRLEEEGYVVQKVQVPQPNDPKKKTTVAVLCKPGTEWKEVAQNIDKVKLVTDVYSEDGGQTIRPVREYVSVDPKRVGVRYAEDGGTDKDGVIELRRNVDDISLGRNNYAQVRILIGDDHYAKGMAVYSDDMPPGVDILINSNKKKGTPLMVTEDQVDPETGKVTKARDAKQVLKPADDDPNRDNPFGASIKPDEKLTRAQRHYTDENGVERQSALNIVKEEGDVDNWDRKLPSQFLSKQTPALAQQQLKMKLDIAKAEFDEIAAYSNPTIKAAMLNDFAGKCDSDSVHLAAAALPRQANKFILPLTNVRENEVYAPGYRDGEQLALVRFPHASITEIPILMVNNNNAEAKKIFGDSVDAVGIHPKAAERLSGADFDGDTVLAIPTASAAIRNRPQYEGLKDFDTKAAYPGYTGMKPMTHQQHGIEMGKVSNLITDMTIKGASDKELEMAIKHSMVVVDAEKHKLNYKQSEIDNHIPELKARYQDGGASTFLSRSTSPEHINERKEKPFSKMNPEEKKRYLNGEMVYEYTGPKGTKKTKVKTDFMPSRMTKEEKEMWNSGDPEKMKQVRRQMLADGRERKRVEEVTMEVNKGEIYNPYDLVSTGNRETTKRIERVYADYAVSMKDLARQARKMAREQIDIPYDPQAAKKYEREVKSLNNKLAKAEMNSPLERQALIKANYQMRLILRDNPDLKNDKEHFRREKSRQLQSARESLGAKKLTIGGSDKNPLTEREYEAIQSGAIRKTTLKRIIANSDKKRIRELAMPRSKTGIPDAKLARAKNMLKNGYTRAEICDMLDVSEGKLLYALEQQG